MNTNQNNGPKMSDVMEAARLGGGEIYAELGQERVDGTLLACRACVTEFAGTSEVLFIRADDVWVREIRLADILTVGPLTRRELCR